MDNQGTDQPGAGAPPAGQPTGTPPVGQPEGTPPAGGEAPSMPQDSGTPAPAGNEQPANGQ